MRILLLTLLLATNTLASASTESLAHIKNTVETFIFQHYPAPANTRLEVNVSNLDPRLNLKQCASQLNVFIPSGKSIINTSLVGVRCTGDKPWQIYLPINIQLLTLVVVSNRPLSRKMIIGRHDLTLMEKDVNELKYGYFTAPEEIIGQSVKYSIANGQVVTPKMITRPIVVKRGQSVNIIAQSSNVRVLSQGIAMSSGAIGDEISVKNTTSKKIIRGTVNELGEIEVNI